MLSLGMAVDGAESCVGMTPCSCVKRGLLDIYRVTDVLVGESSISSTRVPSVGG